MWWREVRWLWRMLVCIGTSSFCCVLTVEMRTVQDIVNAELGRPWFLFPENDCETWVRFECEIVGPKVL